MKKFFLAMLCSVVELFISFQPSRADFIPRPLIFGWQKITRQVAMDTLQTPVFQHPCGSLWITSSDKHVLLISDNQWHRVVFIVGRYAPAQGGDTLEDINKFGQDILVSPYGICKDSSNDVYVVDKGDNKVKAFRFDYGSNQFNFIRDYGGGQLNQPTDGVILGNRLYITDTNNSRIISYKLDLSDTTVFGS